MMYNSSIFFDIILKLKGFAHKHMYFALSFCWAFSIATLGFGSRPKQGLTRMRAKKESQESHHMLLGVQKSVRDWTLTLPNELPFWELESQMDS
jgi:hypothetical protein